MEQNKTFSLKEMAAASQFNKERDYWLTRLSGELVKSSFPLDYPYRALPNAGEKKPETEAIKFTIEGELFTRLMKLRNGQDSTLHMVLVAGIVVLLEKYSGNTDIIVGTTILKQETKANFINTILAIRNRIEPLMTFKQLLLQVRQTVVDAVKHQNYPLEKLVYQLDIPETQGGFPLFDIGVIVENIHDRQYFNRIDISTLFSFYRTPEIIEGTLEFNPSIHAPESMHRLINHFIRLMNQVIFNIDIHLSQVQIQSPEEVKKVITDFNMTETGFPSQQTVHALFAAQAIQTPHKTAIINKNQAITYKQLDESSDYLAGYLSGTKEVNPDEIVGIIMTNSPELILAMLGVIKAGGAYVPIDPALPEDRIRYILKDAQVRVVITKSNVLDSLSQTRQELTTDISFLCLDSQDIISIHQQTLNNHEPKRLRTLNEIQSVKPIKEIKPNHLAYMIYTSGTTGKPRGVMIDHHSLVNYLWWAKKQYVGKGELAFPLYTTPSFDLTVTSIYLPLITGNSIFVFDHHGQEEGEVPIVEIIENNTIDVVKATPSHLKILQYTALEHPSETNGTRASGHFRIRSFIVGGEELSHQLAQDIHRYFSGKVDIYNEYGPTEATVGCMIHKFESSSEPINGVPIGKPVDNAKIYLLDAGLNPVPQGATGEIYIGGEALARGYANLPQLTAEKFINNPFLSPEAIKKSGSFHSSRLYRSGDKARLLPEGLLEYKGRTDEQVKIRGYRIEIKDIENRLASMDKIDKAVVLAQNDNEGDTFICAYYESHKEIEIEAIRDHLSSELPGYMIPTYFVHMDRIPLTLNGKVDKKALKAVKIGGSTNKYVPPRNRLEETLVEIWSNVLNLEKDTIGIDSDFFELGGHSLRGTIMVSNVHKALNVKVPLSELFKTPTIRSLATHIKGKIEEKYLSISSAELKEYYPLSSSQKRIYILQHLTEDNIGYNEFSIVRLQGPLYREKLENVFDRLIARHDSLRTSFIPIGDEIVQRVQPGVEFKITHREAEAGERDIETIMSQFIRPFNLEQAPLLRVQLVNIGEESHYLLYDIHHIITDGTSMVNLIKEFAALYEEETPEPLRIQYKDFTQWQNSEEGKETLKRQEAYWTGEFKDEIPVLQLKTDNPRPEIQKFEGERIKFTLGPEETATLKACALKQEATLFMLLLGVYNVLLSRLTGQEDIVIGTPIAARRHSDLQRIIGMFVNTLALRNSPERDKRFIDFLREIKSRTLKAFENQEYPFEELVEKVTVHRNMGRNPLFDTILAVQNMDTQTGITRLKIKDLELTQPEFSSKVSKFDISMHVNELGEELFFTLEYSTILFKKETIEQLYTHFIQTALSVAQSPTKKLSQIDIISTEEKTRILNQFNNTSTDYPREKSVYTVFEEQLKSSADRIAVIDEPLQITYRQLDNNAKRLANTLNKEGIATDDIVAVKLEQSLNFIITVMGILKSGAAYLPIDPAYPEDRTIYMLSDSRAKLLISNEPKDRIKNIPISYLNSLDLFKTTQNESEPNHPLRPEETLKPRQKNIPGQTLAYVIYTSGTTGRPKGVLINHYSLINLCYWHNSYYHVTQSDRATKYAGVGFDASVWEIYPYLLAGASLFILPEAIKLEMEELNLYYERQNITISFLPTQVCERFMELDNRSLGRLLTGGDKLRYFRKHRYEIYNNYGPTENTVVSTACKVKESLPNIPIGTPTSNTQIYILDTRGANLQPVGVPGELVISGDSLSRGYLNNPELTFEKFCLWQPGALFEKIAPGPHKNVLYPYSTTQPLNHSTIYRTGDLARWQPEGSIEFLGRSDNQVKVRGNRIEPGEIEGILLMHEAINDTLVSAITDTNGETLLCAYIISDMEIAENDIREYLAKHLPGYMIPSHIVKLDRLPLTANGKVDRKALPIPEITKKLDYIAPRDYIEESIALIWAEVLGISKNIISIDSNFFDLGGHSLKATIVVSKIHRMLDVKIPLTIMFRLATIRELSQHIQTIGKTKYAPIKCSEEKEYYKISHAQKRLWIIDQMKENLTAYNIPIICQLKGKLDLNSFKSAFHYLIERHEILRTIFIKNDGEPVQKILRIKDTDYNLDYIDLRNNENPLETAGLIVKSELKEGFNLEKGPLLRIKLYQIENEEYIFQFILHHIISDGWSMNVLFSDLMNGYNRINPAAKQPVHNQLPLRIQYKDYSQWQNLQTVNAGLNTQKEYWMQQFSGKIPLLKLPTDKKRPIEKTFTGNQADFVIDTHTKKNLELLGNRTETSLFMILLAAVNTLLYLYTGQEDIVTGSPIAGRQHTELENQVGFYVNTLPIRINTTGIETFHHLLQKVKLIALGAYENQSYPFDLLVEDLGIINDPGRNPLFDVMVVLQNNDYTSNQVPEIPGLKISGIKTGQDTSTFELNFQFTQLNNELYLNVIFDSELFEDLTIQSMGKKLINLLTKICTQETIAIKNLTHDDLLPVQDKKPIDSWEIDF